MSRRAYFTIAILILVALLALLAYDEARKGTTDAAEPQS